MKTDRFVASDGKNYWNCWCATYIHSENGYLIHAFEEGGEKPGYALCGVKTFDGGFRSIPHETEPGCIRCRNILRKRGVLESTPPIAP